MFLLKRDVKINARDETHQTPLHSAQVGLRGHIDVTEILLAQKADVTAQDHQGNTPLHKAILNLLGTDGHPLLNGKWGALKNEWTSTFPSAGNVSFNV